MNQTVNEGSWSTALRGMALLGLESVVLAIGGATLFLGEGAVAAFEANQFPANARENLLIAIGVAAAVSQALAFIILQKRGSIALERVGQRAAPCLPLGLLPLLLMTELWFRHALEFLVLLGAATWICERSLRVSFAAWQGTSLRNLPMPPVIACLHRSHRAPLLVVIIASLGYAGVTGYLTIVDHLQLGTGAYDLGIFDNLMYNAMHGEPFRSSVMFGPGPGNYLVVHAELAMVLFVPFYAIAPGAKVLLVIQACALGGAALPLYLLASTRVGRWSSALIACAYLLYAPLHGGQFYDFHWLPIATPFLFTLFYGLAVGKTLIVIPTTVLLFLLREDVAVGTAVVGLFLLLAGHRPLMSGCLFLSSVVWFGLVKFVIMPHFGNWFFADLYKELMIPGEHGYSSVVKTLLSNPVFTLRHMLNAVRLEYLLHIFAPLAFLPLRRSALWLLMIPGVFFTVLQSSSAAMSIKYHYSTHFTAYVFGAAVLFLGTLSDSKVKQRAALLSLAFAMLCHSTVFGVIIKPTSFIGASQPVSYSLSQEQKQTLANLHHLINMIPRDASVTATDFDVPHLSNRSQIYAIGQSRYVGEYMLLGPKSFHLAATRANIRHVLANYPFKFVSEAGEFTLWQQNHTPKDRKAADLARRKLMMQLGAHSYRGGPPSRPAQRGAQPATKPGK